MTNNHDNQNEKAVNNENLVEESAPLGAAEESYKEQLLRLTADFANYKRRVEKERTEWMTSAQGSVLEKLLGIFDELDRAIDLAESQQDANKEAWLAGFKLIQKNWQKTFNELGIEEIATTGTFDPMLHEGLVQVEDTSKESGSVAQTFSKGYRFKGKVLRHAKVSVVK